MRFTLSLPTDRVDRPDEYGSAAAVAEISAAAEQAGFDAVFVTEHPIPADDWLATGGHHALDPFVALAFVAATTTRLRLMTNLTVVPYRNPFLLAKAVASLDSLSGGRVVLGAAAGYMEEEFRALGVPFEERNDLFDESLITMKQVWSGQSIAIQGRHFEASGNAALPRPVQLPHPPIWIGGNSTRAIRRVAEHGDGWCPFPSPERMAARVHTAVLASLDDLKARLDRLQQELEKAGRTGSVDIMFMPLTSPPYGREGFSADRFLEEVDVQRGLGVTQMGLGFTPIALHSRQPPVSRTEFLELVHGFGEEVIARCKT